MMCRLDDPKDKLKYQDETDPHWIGFVCVLGMLMWLLLWGLVQLITEAFIG